MSNLTKGKSIPDHHAFLLVGDRELLLVSLQAFLSKEYRVTISGNPDVSVREHERFGIDEARELQRSAFGKAFVDRKYFVLSCAALTHEAQNALLKLLEEPPQDTLFFIIVSRAEDLLPTLRSRLFPLSLATSQKGKEDETLAHDFLRAAGAKRLALLVEMLEEKDKEKAMGLLNGIEEILYRLASPQNMDMQTRNALSEIIALRRYVSGRSPSLKPILEHLAVTLPMIPSKTEDL